MRDIDRNSSSNNNSKVKAADEGNTDEFMRAKLARDDRELISVTRDGRKGAEHKKQRGAAVRIAKVVVDAIN